MTAIIRDYSIFNQTELAAKVTAGGIKHDLLFGVEVGHDGYDNQAYYRNGSCNGVALTGASSPTSGYCRLHPGDQSGPTAPAGSRRVSQAGNHANRFGQYHCHLCQRHHGAEQAIQAGDRLAL